ncbi:MAG: DUF721 domain-containing protein [Betaproteobacteria bacterium]|nr:DUF721 domain-containing protein [Betaproteobacteria bacterium]
MATRPLARLLRENADLEQVRDRLAEVTLLQERFRQVAPATLSQACRVCAVDGSTVVVRADNAPVGRRPAGDGAETAGRADRSGGREKVF